MDARASELSPRALAQRLDRLERLLAGAERGRLDPSVLDRGKLLRLFAGSSGYEVGTEELGPASVTTSRLGTRSVTRDKLDVNFGSGSLSPAATTVITSAAIPHGLDAAPSFIFVAGEAPLGFGAGLGWNVVDGSVNASDFRVQMNASANVTATLTYWWIAFP